MLCFAYRNRRCLDDLLVTCALARALQHPVRLAWKWFLHNLFEASIDLCKKLDNQLVITLGGIVSNEVHKHANNDFCRLYLNQKTMLYNALKAACCELQAQLLFWQWQPPSRPWQRTLTVASEWRSRWYSTSHVTIGSCMGLTQHNLCWPWRRSLRPRTSSYFRYLCFTNLSLNIRVYVWYRWRSACDMSKEENDGVPCREHCRLLLKRNETGM